MRRRPRRFAYRYLVAASLVCALSAGATIGWAWSAESDPLGVRFSTPDASTAADGNRNQPDPATTATGDTGDSGTGAGSGPGRPMRPGVSGLPSVGTPGRPSAPAAEPTTDGRKAAPGHSGACRTAAKLVPTCGILWGVAPGAFTDARGSRALRTFEKKTGRHQDIYHAYHKGTKAMFPTREEIAIAREPGNERILFLNWKPRTVSWAKIAKGDRDVDRYLDKLAKHINANFPEEFFFTVHHEAEDNVREKPGSGYTAKDYAAMYRYVVQRLRARGVDNLVTVLVHMAYVPHTTKKWFNAMYPGDDVIDWIGFDTYAYSDPGYGHGDFAELLNRRSSARPTWPGFYNWAVSRHPDKPLMVAEWGVWSSKRNPGHKAEFYREVGRQIPHFPRIKAMVHFETPHNQDGRDSRVDVTPESLRAYRKLGSLPFFQVQVVTDRR
jgi:hypothetical protein